MGEHTRIPGSLWYWEPFIELSYRERNFWLGIYTSSESKRLVPGLFHGGIHAMANAAKMPSDDTLAALDALIDSGMICFDQRKSVLRLCRLPDAGEKPFNGAAVRGWHSRFITVPACRVRDDHIDTLAWILDTAGCTSADHEKAWRETFGRIRRDIHALEPSGAQRLSDSDTSTKVQPSLFSTQNQRKQIPGSTTPSTTPSTTRVDLRSDLDLYRGESLRGELSTGQAPTAPDGGGRPRLQLVPELPQEEPLSHREEHARQMKNALQDAARACGAPWLAGE